MYIKNWDKNVRTKTLLTLFKYHLAMCKNFNRVVGAYDYECAIVCSPSNFSNRLAAFCFGFFTDAFLQFMAFLSAFCLSGSGSCVCWNLFWVPTILPSFSLTIAVTRHFRSCEHHQELLFFVLRTYL
jgi:hypothetical protein